MNNLAHDLYEMTPLGQSPDKDPEFHYRPVDEGTASGLFIEEGGTDRITPLMHRPVWSVTIDGKRYCATKPIMLRVHREGEWYFSTNNTLSICGTGLSPQESISDAIQHLAHYSKYYKSLGYQQVVGEAVNLKKIFEKLFVPE